jgi:iron(III) transport system ATP-binding protein
LNKPLLTLENVTCRFSAQGTAAVANLSLAVHEGELLSLLGPSGCGKTTLLRLIAGFEQPQTGLISLAGCEVSCPQCNLPPEQRQVGMVFQDYALFPHLTVVENIAFGLTAPKHSAKNSPKGRSLWTQIRGFLPQRSLFQYRQRIEAMLELVGLQGLENRYPHQLSGGQQQRVALARALAPQPRLILLDEPLSNLDIQVRLHLRQELRQILKQAGTTAILVTHDQEEALAISDRIAVMYRGQLEQVGEPQQVYQQPATRFVAEFVTQANFLPLERSASGGQITPLGSGPVSSGPLASGALTSGAVSVGSMTGGSMAGATMAGQTEIGWVELPASSDLESPQVLMVRQEDLILQTHPEGIAEVVDWEFLGRDQRYHLRLPSGQVLKVRQPLSVHYPCGDRVWIGFPPQFSPVLFPDPSPSVPRFMPAVKRPLASIPQRVETDPPVIAR